MAKQKITTAGNIGAEQAQTVNNYYIDNRTQVVVNQPTRTVLVTNKEYDALMNRCETFMRLYNDTVNLVRTQEEQTREITARAVSLMLENKALRDEVQELRSRLYALGDGEQ